MKKLLTTVLGFSTIVAALSLSSCKKSDDSSSPAPATTNTNQTTQSSDESAYSDASNESMNSANNGLASSSASRVAGSISVVANADVKLNLTKDTLTINFTGDNAEGTSTRSGKMSVYLVDKMQRWYTKGAQWRIDYGTGVTFTRKSDSKKVKLTGYTTVTNTTEGNVYASIGGVDSVAHQIDGQLQVTFDNETVAREWTVARIRTVVKDGAAYRIRFMGNGPKATAVGSFDNVSEYGTNRFGTAFTATIDKPLVLQYCGARYKFVAGVVTHHTASSKDITASYGVDAQGSAVVNGCDATSMKVTFVNSVNTTVNVILGL